MATRRKHMKGENPKPPGIKAPKRPPPPTDSSQKKYPARISLVLNMGEHRLRQIIREEIQNAQKEKETA